MLFLFFFDFLLIVYLFLVLQHSGQIFLLNLYIPLFYYGNYGLNEIKKNDDDDLNGKNERKTLMKYSVGEFILFFSRKLIKIIFTKISPNSQISYTPQFPHSFSFSFSKFIKNPFIYVHPGVGLLYISLYYFLSFLCYYHIYIYCLFIIIIIKI
jgi:hypothetical protein